MFRLFCVLLLLAGASASTHIFNLDSVSFYIYVPVESNLNLTGCDGSIVGSTGFQWNFTAPFKTLVNYTILECKAKQQVVLLVTNTSNPVVISQFAFTQGWIYPPFGLPQGMWIFGQQTYIAQLSVMEPSKGAHILQLTSTSINLSPNIATIVIDPTYRIVF